MRVDLKLPSWSRSFCRVYNRVRKVSTDGVISTLAGDGRLVLVEVAGPPKFNQVTDNVVQFEIFHVIAL